MPENIRCASCGLTVYGFRSGKPTPFGDPKCPDCGEREFEYIEEED